jgi:hypothetical protein
MTHPLDEHGDRLRRALRAEADAVMPSPDGLDRIRARIAHDREQRGWRGFRTRVSGLPWLRPIAAAAVAVAVATVALAAPPVINNITGDTIGGRGPGADGGPPSHSGGFPASTPPPYTQFPTGSPTPRPNPSTSESPSSSVDASCRRPGTAAEPTPDPSSAPSQAPKPPEPCTPSPEPPTSPKPGGGSGSTDPTPPTTGTQDPAAPGNSGQQGSNP